MCKTKKRKSKFVFAACLFLLLAAIALGLMSGTFSMNLTEVLKTLTGNGDKLQDMAVFQLRLPRICLALMVGTALAVSGIVLQSVTHNPLAEPGLIGINAGAALAVVLLISSSGTQYYSALSMRTVVLMPLVSIAGAFLSFLCVYLLAYRRGVKPMRLILTGIGVNAGINALITYYQLNMSKGDYNQALTWTSGSLWGSSWLYFAVAAPVILVLLAIVLYKSRTLDACLLGEELALGLGIEIQKENRIFLLLAVALAAVSTAVAGNIAFVGLLGPHIAKRLVGPVHIRQIPAAACISGFFLIVADTASRNLFTPLEIPVGITMSILGVPYFIYLMLKEK